jgi:DNA-binding CsgD family transcriptional regulator
MIQNDQHWVTLIDTIHAAGLGIGAWACALDGIASATGSRSGQLIGVGSDATVPFNLMTNADPGFAQHFAQRGGGDPRINPRVGAGGSAPVLRVLSESDYLTQDQYYRHPFLQEVHSTWGYAFSCLTPLERREGMLFGLAELRTRSEGHISSAQRDAFPARAPHLRAAVRTQLALEDQGAQLLAGTMENLSIAAFICDRHGHVRRLTPSAERLVADGSVLRLRGKKLEATRRCDVRALENAMTAPSAIKGATENLPALRSIVLRSEKAPDVPVIVDVIDLPARHSGSGSGSGSGSESGPGFGFAPTTLVIVRGESQREASKTAVMRAAYELSVAEAEVALLLSKGENAESIAKRRHVSVGTVRAQIKKISAKLGVKSQIELVARINRL